MSGSRADGTNPRALGESPRQRGTSKRKLGITPRQIERIEAVMRRKGEALTPDDRMIPRWLRFEILKRDSFRCTYCGLGSREGAILQIDHIHPVSKGGLTVPVNLTTSCLECNSGKSATLLKERAL